MRMLLSEYRKTAFVGRAPTPNTLKSWIREGSLPGEKLGGLWFVHVDESGNPRSSLNRRPRSR